MKWATKKAKKKTVFSGVNELARRVGLHKTSVSKKLRNGMTPEEILQEADMRAKGQMLPPPDGRNGGYAGFQKRKSPVQDQGQEQNQKQDKQDKPDGDYVPRRLRGKRAGKPAKLAAARLGSRDDADDDTDIGDDVDTDDNEFGDNYPAPENFLKAKERKERALASKVEVEVAQRLGILAPTVAINQHYSEMITYVRDECLKMPGDLKDDLAAEVDPDRVEEILDKRIREVLSGFKLFKPRILIRGSGVTV